VAFAVICSGIRYPVGKPGKNYGDMIVTIPCRIASNSLGENAPLRRARNDGWERNGIMMHGRRKKRVLAFMAAAVLAGSWPAGTGIGQAHALGMTEWVQREAHMAAAAAGATARAAKDVRIAATAAAQAPSVQLVDETPVTSGAVHRRYIWNAARSGKEIRVKADVLVVDLANPYVELDLMIGRQGKVATHNTVTNMAGETGAVAGINGDVYNMNGQGASIGGQVKSGTMVSSPTELAGMYAFALTEDRRPVIDLFSFEGRVSKDGMTYYPLAGVNKAASWIDGRHSHADAIHLYTSDWGSKERGEDGATVPTEMLVQNGRVIRISAASPLDMLVPEGGYILRASGKAAAFLTEHFAPGDPIYIDYQLKSATGGANANYRMMIGGHTILVDGGQAAAFSRDIGGVSGSAARSRTAIGYSQDGRYVYLITADKSADSDGMTLKELQSFMIAIGVWKGVNLDGGGSTQMVARPLGETSAVLVSGLEQGVARRVVNGLGVYTTAPAGNVLGLFVSGEDVYFINERAQLALKAYDEYYNPIIVDPSSIQWTSSDETVAMFDGTHMTGMAPGSATVTATSVNGIAASAGVQVAGRADLAELRIDADDFLIAEGNSYTLSVTAVTKQGTVRKVPAELIDWTFIGFDGTVAGDTVTVTRVHEGVDTGRFIARYDGYGAMLTKAVGTDTLFADFDAVNPPITPQSTHGEIPANIRLQQAGNSRTNTLVFDYDFTEGSGTKAIYAAFGEDGKGIAIPGKPSMLRLNVLGDASLNWLRAEFVDGSGETRLVDLATPVNWNGWKKVALDLEELGLSAPLTLRRIYVASPASGQEERMAVGLIAVDDIEFQQKRELPEMHRAKVEMALGRETITVDGEEQQLDFAPYAVNGHTLIPIRFFVDALGGEVLWDQATRRASVIRDGHLVEMWVLDGMVTVNGKPAVSPVPPQVKGGRTMLPLRFIAEVLGWDVGWNNETKSITLQ